MASGSHRSGSNSSSIQESWWWDAIEIVEEDGKRYRVRWAGKDETGKPWPLEWVPNSHCSADLTRDWEKKKGANSYNCATLATFSYGTIQGNRRNRSRFLHRRRQSP